MRHCSENSPTDNLSQRILLTDAVWYSVLFWVLFNCQTPRQLLDRHQDTFLGSIWRMQSCALRRCNLNGFAVQALTADAVSSSSAIKRLLCLSIKEVAPLSRRLAT